MFTLYFLCAVGWGCSTGQVSNIEYLPTSPGQPGSPGGAVPRPAPGKYVPPPAQIRMLTESQFVQALNALGILNIQAPLEMAASSNAAAKASPSTALIEAFERIARDAARKAVGDANWMATHVPCSINTIECRRLIAAKLGELAFRRPFSSDELTAYSALFEAEATRWKSPAKGLEYIIAALLQSPDFLYRVELDDSNSKLDAFAVASKLSFLLTNGPPDSVLRELAQSGSIFDPAVRLAQAERILKLPPGQVGVGAFFEDWFQLQKVKSISKDAQVFPAFSKAMASAMAEQSVRATLGPALDDSDMRTLFDDTGADVNSVLAPVYQVTVQPSDGWLHFSSAEIGPRPGVLSWPSMLALYSKETHTSVTERGVFVRTDVLCDTVPPAPDDVPVLEPPAPGEVLTTRQIFERHRKTEPCKSCHTVFDPLGIALETFDAIGRARTTENGLPIDASSDFDGVPVANAAEMGEAIFKSPMSARCMVSKLHAYATGKVGDTDDEPLIDALFQKFQDGTYRWMSLLTTYVASEEFIATPSPL